MDFSELTRLELEEIFQYYNYVSPSNYSELVDMANQLWPQIESTIDWPEPVEDLVLATQLKRTGFRADHRYRSDELETATRTQLEPLIQALELPPDLDDLTAINRVKRILRIINLLDLSYAQELRLAAQRNQTDRVEELLVAHLDQPNQTKLSPMLLDEVVFEITLQGHDDLLNVARSIGIHVSGQTAYNGAVFGQHYSLAEQIRDDPELSFDLYLEEMIIQAIDEGRLEAVRYGLDELSDQTSPDLWWTDDFLTTAVEADQPEIVELLLERVQQANLKFPSSQGQIDFDEALMLTRQLEPKSAQTIQAILDRFR